MKIPLRQRTKIELQNVFFIELIFYKIISIRKRHFKNIFRRFYLDTRLVGWNTRILN